MDVSCTWDDEKLVAKFRRDEPQNFLRYVYFTTTPAAK